MKVICSKEALLSGVNAVQRVVSKKNTQPILEGILVKSDRQFLQFSATDLEIGVRCEVPAEVLEEGVIVIPAKIFTEFVRKLPDTEITLEEKDRAVKISYFDSEIILNGYDPEEFPLLPDLLEPLIFTLTNDVFKMMIKKTIFACASEENRPVFNGVLMQIEEKQIKLVATDTHRLAYICSSMTDDGKKSFSGIIPSRTLSEINRLLREEDEILEIHISENQLVFQFGSVHLVSRLIEGIFPNYKQVIPQTCETKLKLDKSCFLEMIERASLLAQDKGGVNIVRFCVEKDELKIDQTSESGKISEKISVEMEGNDVTVAFNARFLIDVLRVISSEQIVFELSGPYSPGVMRPVDEPEYIYIVLPVRTA